MTPNGNPDVITLSERWERLWFEPVPPHLFAIIRIALGLLVLQSAAGLMPIGMFWSLNGLTPLPSAGSNVRQVLIDQGWSAFAGGAYLAALVASASAMTIGYRTQVTVPATFLALVLQTHWNHLPLSSAHNVVVSLLFCLIWTNAGEVLSFDARTRPAATGDVPAWPLWLMRLQVATIYLSSGLWKLMYPAWRDGSAVHWALNLNGFHRFPWPVPVQLEPVLSLLTWGTLFFELAFPVAIWFRRVRTATLLMGIGLHVGLHLALEIGPFSFVMIASYLAFLDPHRTAQRLSGLLKDRVARSAVGA